MRGAEGGLPQSPHSLSGATTRGRLSANQTAGKVCVVVGVGLIWLSAAGRVWDVKTSCTLALLRGPGARTGSGSLVADDRWRVSDYEHLLVRGNPTPWIAARHLEGDAVIITLRESCPPDALPGPQAGGSLWAATRLSITSATLLASDGTPRAAILRAAGGTRSSFQILETRIQACRPSHRRDPSYLKSLRRGRHSTGDALASPCCGPQRW
jgi:hypothetical protein